MSFVSKLAELVVEFSAKGVSGLQGAVQGIKGQLEGVQSAVQGVGRLAEVFIGIQAVQAANSLAKAGLSSSAAGQVLNFQMGMLSRTIAGLFTPEINRAIVGVREITVWIQSLTGQQRESLASWIKFAAITATTAIILPRLVGGLSMVTTAIKGMTVALFAGGLGGVLSVVAQIAAAFTAIGVGSVAAGGGLTGIFRALQPMLNAVSTVLQNLMKAMQPLQEIGQRVFGAIGKVIIELVNLLGKLAEAFLPIIAIVGDALVPVLEGLASIISFLSTLITENTVKWAAAIATLYIVIRVVPVVIGAIRSLISMIRALTTAQVIQQALSGPTGWAQLAAGAAIAAAAVAGVVVAFNAIDAKYEEFKTKMAREGKAVPNVPGNNRGALAPGNLPGIEDPSQTWRRIAELSRLGIAGKPVQEQQLDTQKQQLAEQQRTNRNLENRRRGMGWVN